jgi:Lon protease-like protein
MAREAFKPGHDVDARVARMLPRMPIFPLPDVVLFPGAMLPLHIFEPRYREMTEAVLAGTGVLGMATLVEADSKAELPPIHRIIGIGEIVAHEQLPDGRYNLLLRGISRATVDLELPPVHPYREVQAHRLDDIEDDSKATSAAARALMAMTDRLATTLPTGGDRLRALARSADGPARLADVLAAALISAGDTRRELMEDVVVARRLDRLLSEVGVLVANLGPNKDSAPN